MHLVAWDILRSPKTKRGMGLRRLGDMNAVLICKWLWRLGSDEGWLWKQVVIEKYGIQDMWNLNVICGSYRVSLWKGIIRHMDSIRKKVRYEVGIGDMIKF